MRKLFLNIIKHSTLVIIITVIVTAFFGISALRLKIDPSIENLIPEHSEVTQLLQKYGTESSADGYFIVAISSEDPFTLEGLQAFDKSIHEIETLTGISRGITPFNAVVFTKSGRQLKVGTLSPESRAPQTAQELAEFKELLVDNPFYAGTLISRDGKTLSAVFPSEPLTDEAEAFMQEYSRIRAELEKYYRVYTTGDVPISDRSNTYLSKDLVKLFLFALAFMLVSFYFGFRSKRSFLLPISVVLAGTVWTLGFMALMGYQLNVVSLTIPPLVLSIGSSYTIHILNQYYRDAQPDRKDKLWIVEATLHINKTVFLACLTTVVGFMSLMFTSIDQTKEFGISTSFGITACMILSSFYLPAMLSKIRPPTEDQKQNVLTGTFAQNLGKLGDFVYRFRYMVLVLFAVILGLFIYAYPRIPSQSDYMSYFPKDDSVVQETSYILENVGGYQTMNVTITAPDNEKNYFLRPEILEQISDFELEILEDVDVTSVSSISFYIRELNFLMNGKKEIPSQKGLISLLSRYLKLIRSSEDANDTIRQMTNDDFSRITLTFKIYNSRNNRILAEAALGALVDRFNISMEKHLKNMDVALWSVDLRYLYLSEMLTRDQNKSILAAIIFVFIIALIYFRNIGFAVLTLTPLFSGLMLNFICMAFLKIPLDMTTLMVTSIVIGVGVDNAIHYNIQFKKNFDLIGKVKEAINLTHMEAGRPIMHTTISIVGGLLFLVLSSFRGISYFGLLICFTLTFTMIGTLVLLPAFIGSFYKNKVKTGSAE